MSMIDLHAASSGPAGESRMCMIASKMHRVRLSMKHAREQARGLGGGGGERGGPGGGGGGMARSAAADTG